MNIRTYNPMIRQVFIINNIWKRYFRLGSFPINYFIWRMKIGLFRALYDDMTIK